MALPLVRLPHGAPTTLPCVVLHGAREGPRVWMNAAVHGDELTGIEVVRRLIARVRPRSLSGTLLLVPMVNIYGVTAGTRYLPDRRDLNRCFPGGANGSMAARLAYTLLTEIVDRCEVGVDMHSGSDHRQNLPQIRANLSDERTRALALAFAPPVIIDANERAGSLRGEASARGKTVLLYEGGGPHCYDEEAVQVGERGALRVLRHLGMLRSDAEIPGPSPLISTRTRWTRASRGGLFRPTVGLGQTVKKNENLGLIADAMGRTVGHPGARVDGVVIALRRNPVVFQGDAIVHVAEVEGARPKDTELDAPT